MKKTADAVVLAGGKGTRLAPLTEDTPKPLLKVMGRTVLENVYARISKAGIKNAYVTTMYLPWQIESLGTSYGETRISYVREKEPLGTAGAAAAAYEGDADAVIILSGDGFYNFDLKKALDFHYEKNADVTIVTYTTDNPEDYGIVLYGDDGRILRFEEKPPWAKVVSCKVNTGIYILRRDILKSIPKNEEYDFAKQLFPLLLARGKQMYAYEAEGVWHDIGSLDSYFEANRSALEGKIGEIKNDGFTEKELKEHGVETESPFYVSRKAVIGTNVKIGAYTVIGDGVVISDNCDISSSIISDGVKLGNGCGIYGSIIGRNTKFGENCIISEGCAIGANAFAEDSIILPKYTFIHSSSRISASEYRDVPSGKREKNIFSEDGINCDISEKSPEYIMRIGFAAAKTALDAVKSKNVRIGIMTDGNSACDRLGSLILEGMRCSGIKTMRFGSGFESIARFASRYFITDYVIYVSRHKDGHIFAKIFDGTGFDVPESFERAFTSSFFSHTGYSCPEHFYEPEIMEGIYTLYYSELVKELKSHLKKDEMKGFICTFGNMGDVKVYTPTYTAICAITELGGDVTSKPEEASVCFEIDGAGKNSACHSRDASLDSYHMNAAVLSEMKPEKSGETLYFSSTMPDAYMYIAERNGFGVSEFASCIDKGREVVDFDGIKKLCFLEDGVFRTLYFAVMLHETGKNLRTVLENLPAFEIFSKDYESTMSRAHVMHRLASLAGFPSGSKWDNREGIRISLSGGSVTVIPKKLHGFKIISEATAVEAARELCESAEEYLK